MSADNPQEVIDDRERDWDGYDKYRAQLEALRVQQVASFDNSIINLSSGALGLSVVLLTALAALIKPVQLEILFATWTVFVLCIIANLLSYQTGAKAAEIEIQALDAEMRAEQPNSSTFWRTLTVTLNRSVILLFPIGAILLLLFAAFNAAAVSEKRVEVPASPPSATTSERESD